MRNILKLIAQQLNKEELTALTESKAIPDYKESNDVHVIHSVFHDCSISLEDIAKESVNSTLAAFEDRIYSKKKRNESLLDTYNFILLKGVILVKEESHRQQLLGRLMRNERSVQFVLDFVNYLNKYMELITESENQVFSTRSEVEKMYNNPFYGMIHPLYDLDDKFIPYIYFYELGKLLIDEVSNAVPDNLEYVNLLVSHIRLALYMESENKRYTDLDRYMLESVTNTLLIYRHSLPDGEDILEEYVEILADYLNSKIWLLMIMIDSRDAKLQFAEDLFKEPELARFISEYFVSPMFTLYSNYFEKHIQFPWAIYSSGENTGLVKFLVQQIFLLLNGGVKMDPLLFDGIFELMCYTLFDHGSLRTWCLTQFYYAEFPITSFIKGKLDGVFNSSMMTINSIDQTIFSKYINDDEYEGPYRETFQFTKLLFNLIRDLDS